MPIKAQLSSNWHIGISSNCQIVSWAVMDSNHRRRKPAELQSAPFGHSGNCPFVRRIPLKKNSLFILLVECNHLQSRDCCLIAFVSVFAARTSLRLLKRIRCK